MCPHEDLKINKDDEQFCVSFGEGREHFVVRLEKKTEDTYVIHYGTYPNLATYPIEQRWALHLETVQFLGRLLSDNHIPEEIKSAYKVWLIEVEKRFI